MRKTYSLMYRTFYNYVSFRNVTKTTQQFGKTTMLCHAAIIICVRRMIGVVLAHAQGHRSHALNANVVMEVGAK